MTQIKIYRDSYGYYWMESEEIQKLVGDMDVNSSKTIDVLVMSHGYHDVEKFYREEKGDSTK